MTKAERLMAVKGDLKNWDWTVHPQFKLEKEDGEALLDLLQKMGERNNDNDRD